MIVELHLDQTEVFPVLARAAMADADGRYINTQFASEEHTDQQGWPVLRHEIATSDAR